jgi:carboxyl-terminal processing protease
MTSLFLGLFLLFSAAPEDEIEASVKRFTEAYAAVESHAADPFTADQAFYEGAIPGMLRKLDPHSVFFNPDQFEQLKRIQESRDKGFGSVVSLLPGRVVVLQTLPGSPSAKSGLAAGDEIISINGYRIAMLDTDQLIQLLSASRQRQAYLDVRRPGNARTLQFVLVPEEMQSPSVDRVYFLRAGVGYIRVTNFDLDTGKAVEGAIEKLGGKNLRGLVLDLRKNPGGSLPSALHVASLFLKPGQPLLSVRGRRIEETKETVPEKFTNYTFPLAVLIDARSASAAEVVAGALQDHDRAAILGETSYGKGLVQAVYPLSSSTGMALTTSFYYTPAGRSIQRPLEGVELTPGSATEATFRTDSGREVQGAGGIRPDQVVQPEGMTRFRAVLEATGSFTSFATLFLQRNQVDEDFELSPAVMDEFQLFLSTHNIRPGVAEWSQEREYLSNRLLTEIFNQALGVEKGEEIEARRDPVILAALRSMQVD